MSFIARNEFVYWEQTYLFRFYEKKNAQIFCDLCNLFLKYNPIRTFEKESENGKEKIYSQKM